MKNFEYTKAATAEGACELSGTKTRFHGGGVDLLGEMKDYLVSPKRVIDVSGLDRQITEQEDHWLVGGAARLSELIEHEGLTKSLPGLAQAAQHVGSPQIRNVATVGGNLAQHSRCWYYRQPGIKCLKQGGFSCYAREGINKFHSIFAQGACISPLVSNLGVALAALEATVQVMHQGTVRDVSTEAFYADADINPRAHNSLNPGDLVVSVKIPKQRGRSAYLQVSEKGSFDWALVSCAAAAEVVSGVARNVRLYLGVVAPVPYTVEKATAFLEGKSLNEKTVTEAARLLVEEAEPFEHNAYKVPMAQAMAKRTLLALEAS
jgi:xanthine dehydrogenase YagS FAD-binding subunit